MFVMNLATELQPKRKKSFIIFIFAALTAFAFTLYFTFANEPKRTGVIIESKSKAQQPSSVEFQPDLVMSPQVARDCGKVSLAYDLLGVVFDQQSVLALVEVLETGSMLLIDKREVSELRLNSAELTKAEFQLNECHFTLFLN